MDLCRCQLDFAFTGMGTTELIGGVAPRSVLEDREECVVQLINHRAGGSVWTRGRRGSRVESRGFYSIGTNPAGVGP